MKEQPKRILILIGHGKSTLVQFITDMVQDDYSYYSIYGTKDLKKKCEEIKRDVGSGFRVFIHLDNEDDVKRIPIGLRRRALIFKIDF